MDIPIWDLYRKDLKYIMESMKQDDCEHRMVYYGVENGLPIFKCHKCKQFIKKDVVQDTLPKFMDYNNQTECFDRQDAVKKWIANSANSSKPDSDISDEKINKFHYFEILDRIHVIQCTIDDMIKNHPAVKEPLESEVRKSINEIQDHLTYIYQWASMRFDELCEK